MVERLIALDGPKLVLAWVGIASVLIGMVSVLLQAAIKAPVRIGSSLMFRTAFVCMFARIVYRLLDANGRLSYSAVAIYALPGLACAWGMYDTLRYRHLVNAESTAKLAYDAAQQAENTAAVLRAAADTLRSDALERAQAAERTAAIVQTAANTERTATATEAIAEQGIVVKAESSETPWADGTIVAKQTGGY